MCVVKYLPWRIAVVDVLTTTLANLLRMGRLGVSWWIFSFLPLMHRLLLLKHLKLSLVSFPKLTIHT
ncbi:hypothetical protein MtrunA17_Chr8g0337831 [Medicago truncatula]|uniref:Transmembrane protein n=1 Tax=Medicago truncatula TaxID=3880 RepID=A0A396GGW2_MEDTR|nr:hypothetical protein MtrunA17_Chr8g0337831 [Medicago truncatula]